MPVEHQHLLLMCGSIGCGPIKELAEELSIRLTAQQELTIVCGANEELFAKLEKLFGLDPRIHIHGMVDYVPLLMHSANLFLTKPGGLSTSEAAVCGVPMLLMDTVAGCEGHNLDFFLRQGIAVTADTPKLLADTAMALLADPDQLQMMTCAARHRSGDMPSEAIYTFLHRRTKQRTHEEQYA